MNSKENICKKCQYLSLIPSNDIQEKEVLSCIFNDIEHFEKQIFTFEQLDLKEKLPFFSISVPKSCPYFLEQTLANEI